MKFTVIIVSFLGMNLEFSKYLSWILISMLYYFILSDQDGTKSSTNEYFKSAVCIMIVRTVKKIRQQQKISNLVYVCIICQISSSKSSL